ncbi:MAG: hypothetical protein AAF561_00650 [Planctomycetota bacterium]
MADDPLRVTLGADAQPQRASTAIGGVAKRNPAVPVGAVDDACHESSSRWADVILIGGLWCGWGTVQVGSERVAAGLVGSEADHAALPLLGLWATLSDFAGFDESWHGRGGLRSAGARPAAESGIA